jgi:hypothetical protein
MVSSMSRARFFISVVTVATRGVFAQAFDAVRGDG